MKFIFFESHVKACKVAKITFMFFWIFDDQFLNLKSFYQNFREVNSINFGGRVYLILIVCIGLCSIEILFL